MVSGMTEGKRRKRGSAKDYPAIYAQISHDAKSNLTTICRALDIPQAQALDAILLALPLDSDGVPTILDRAGFHRQEELPIPAA